MDLLPENCIAKVLSFTTPRDVCRSSVVSKIFKSAANSDNVWNRFLPSEFPAGVSGPPANLTGKEKFLAFADRPLLMDHGRTSFFLEKSSGKKCYMISPRTLSITWGHDARYWRWISVPDTRFKEVAHLIKVRSVGISARINTSRLSDDTLYAVYLVFMLICGAYGFSEPARATVGLAESQIQPSMVRLTRTPWREGRGPEPRGDGWFEVELGQFFKRRGEIGEVEMSFKKARNPHEKANLILHGIEIRPRS